MKKIIQEYKAFALKGNVLDMAVGIVVGGAFATIASSLVANVIAPILGMITSDVDLADLFIVLKEGKTAGPYLTLEQANKAGAVTLSYGVFLNSFISFLIVSWIAFLLVKGINRVRQKEVIKEEIKTKDCPFCFSKVHKDAARCPYCTSEIKSGAA
ncbi:large conductance mechanosensitive channel protein MscL [Marinobacter maroccanus]|uniref:Large-conductance mechanosensitive channel n=2 Tax=Marinobacter maroccanus TaxID=2055143 RepID=A0A2S5Z7X3_9GAMM|nr:large conductance mechanosensitive channel protein MscL [Marinobacter maroccanus]